MYMFMCITRLNNRFKGDATTMTLNSLFLLNNFSFQNNDSIHTVATKLQK